MNSKCKINQQNGCFVQKTSDVYQKVREGFLRTCEDQEPDLKEQHPFAYTVLCEEETRLDQYVIGCTLLTALILI